MIEFTKEALDPLMNEGEERELIGTYKDLESWLINHKRLSTIAEFEALQNSEYVFEKVGNVYYKHRPNTQSSTLE